MTVSATAPTSLIDSVLQAQTTQNNIGVAVLKKAEDVEKQQGEAMVKMLEQAGTAAGSNGSAPLLDTYA